MQIAGSHIFDQTRLVSLESNSAAENRVGKQQRLRQANDSYSKNAASAGVIDAEYVDLYTPEKVVSQQQNPDITFEPESTSSALAQQLPESPVASRYQLQDPDTPPPGTYINYFA